MIEPPKLQPGDVIRWTDDRDKYGFHAIIGSHELPEAITRDEYPVIAAQAWMEDGGQWTEHSIGRVHLGWGKMTLITGDEADRIHAQYAAAKLRGDVEYRG